MSKAMTDEKQTGARAAAEETPEWMMDAAREIFDKSPRFFKRYPTEKTITDIILKHCPEDEKAKKLSSEAILNNLAKVLSESDPSENDNPDLDEEEFIRRVMTIVNNWRRQEDCPEDKGVEKLVERLGKATKVFRQNWSCHDCEGYGNSTNEPNNEPMCEHCKEIDIMLSAIDFALAEYEELNK